MSSDSHMSTQLQAAATKMDRTWLLNVESEPDFRKIQFYDNLGNLTRSDQHCLCLSGHVGIRHNH